MIKSSAQKKGKRSSPKQSKEVCSNTSMRSTMMQPQTTSSTWQHWWTPRFKTTYMRENRAEYMKNRAVTELLGMVEGATAPPASDQRAVGSQAAEDDPPTKKKTLASYFKKAVPASAHTRLRNRESIELEVAMYLKAPGPASEADPLEWWKQHEVTFPSAARLANKYLCIPATSSSSERAFSASGNIITCKRSCLKPNTVDQLVFLALNL